MHLYEIANGIRSVLDAIDGELSDENCAALDALEMDFTTKAENVAKYIRGEEAEAVAYAAEAKRLSEKAAARKNKAASMKLYLQQCMTALGISSVKGELLKVSLQKNNPSVEIVNYEHIPVDYWVQAEPSIDKKKLLAALKAGEEVRGASLKQSESIRIR